MEPKYQEGEKVKVIGAPAAFPTPRMYLGQVGTVGWTDKSSTGLRGVDFEYGVRVYYLVSELEAAK